MSKVNIQNLFDSLDKDGKAAMVGVAMAWKMQENRQEASILVYDLSNHEKTLVDEGEVVAAMHSLWKRTGKDLTTCRYAVDLYKEM